MRRYPSVALLGYQAGGRAAYGGNNYTLALLWQIYLD
jgi:hypothetical protein